MAVNAKAPVIRFDGSLSAVGSSTILRLPEGASKRLPSRGQVAVEGTINGRSFATVVEPDGQRGHWIRVDRSMQRTADIKAGDMATVAIEVTKDWPEPDVPRDLKAALDAAPQKIKPSLRTSCDAELTACSSRAA